MEAIKKKVRKPIIKWFVVFGFLVICCAQCIDFVKQYLRYPTVQNVYVLHREFLLPAITFCHSLLSHLNSFVKDTECHFMYNDDNFCNRTKNPVIYSKIDHKYCVTFFSALSKKQHGWIGKVNTIFQNLQFNNSFIVEKVGVHSSLMPAQLAKLNAVGCTMLGYFSLTQEVLKPEPFDTGCVIYDKVAFDGNTYRSQYDCKFRCNKNDAFSVLYPTKPDFKNYSKKLFSHKRVCARRCPKHCLYRHYELLIESEIKGINCELFKIRENIARYQFRQPFENTYIVYQEKMSLLYTFIQTGGLLSLWFGFSFIQMVQFFRYRITAKEVTFVVYLLLNILCFYQIAVVLANYLKYETTTNVLVCDNYNTTGVMPEVDIVAPKVVFRNMKYELIQNFFFIKKYIHCSLKYKDGNSKSQPRFVLITTESHGVRYSYSYNRKKIKSIEYQVKRAADLWLFIIIGDWNFGSSWSIPFTFYGSYEITIRQKIFERLPAPFGINCNVEKTIGSYNIDNSRERCIIDCLKEVVERKYNCTHLREDYYFFSNDSYFIGKQGIPCNQTLKLKILFELFGKGGSCQTCKLSCVDNQYQITSQYVPNKKAIEFKVVYVSIEYAKNDFAIVFKSVPRMTPFDLFYESCSLASLWLGFGILSTALNVSFKRAQRLFAGLNN